MSLKEKELRIGNYISYRDEKECVVCSLGYRFVTDNLHNGLSCGSDDVTEYKGIELTKEWLIKFGFEYNSIEAGFFIEISKRYAYLVIDESDLSVAIFGDEKLTGAEYPCMDGGICEHVHQLQNLYFALTNKELILDK